MATICKKGDAYYCTFRYQGRRFHFAVGKVSEEQARAKGTQVDEVLSLLERGLLTLPEGVPLEAFVAAGGKVPVVSARPETITARQLFDHYLATHGNGTIEVNSLGTARTHLNQFAASVGVRFRIQGLTAVNLQQHIDRRQKKGVSAVTLKKEIASVRACWNWSVQTDLIKGTWPGRGLRYPKEAEKEPFRTFRSRQVSDVSVSYQSPRWLPSSRTSGCSCSSI
jgi:hypothetical protein